MRALCPFVLACALLVVQSAVTAQGASTETWTDPTNPQKTFRASLRAVHGPLVVWRFPNEYSRFEMIDRLVPADAVRVADFLAQQPKGPPPTWRDSQSELTRELRSKLVALHEGRLVPFDPGDRPEPRFIAIYFSAGWCGPCHAFTPHLVEAYRSLQAAGERDLEIVFVSWDESTDDMVAYMREMAMPWPALQWNKTDSVRLIERQKGRGIPCLVVFDRDGNMLFHSYRGEEYLGADEPLRQIKQLLEYCRPGCREMADVWYRFQRIVHLERNKAMKVPPKPYTVRLDPSNFREAGITKFNLRLLVADDGTVASAQVEGDLPAALAWQAEVEARRWVFLPKIEGGQYRTAEVLIPIDCTALPAPR